MRLPDGASAKASVYFYNAPLGRAPRIASGDYLEHVRAEASHARLTALAG